jgi:hypothetical protein
MKVIDTQYADNVFISIEKLVKNEKKKNGKNNQKGNMICNHFNCAFFYKFRLKHQLAPLKETKRAGFDGFCPICLTLLFLKLY